MWACVSIGVQEGPLPGVGEEEKEATMPLILAQSSRMLPSDRGFQAVVRARC